MAANTEGCSSGESRWITPQSLPPPPRRVTPAECVMDEVTAAAVTERVEEDSQVVMDVTASQVTENLPPPSPPRCWRACWITQEASFNSIIACSSGSVAGHSSAGIGHHSPPVEVNK